MCYNPPLHASISGSVAGYSDREGTGSEGRESMFAIAEYDLSSEVVTIMKEHDDFRVQLYAMLSKEQRC